MYTHKMTIRLRCKPELTAITEDRIKEENTYQSENEVINKLIEEEHLARFGSRKKVERRGRPKKSGSSKTKNR